MELMDFVKKWNVAYMDKEEQDEFTAEMIEDLAKITAPKDQRIAELEEFRIGANETCAKIVMDTKLLRDRIAELEKDAVLSADAIGLLQHDNARLEKEISDLRRALSECKAKARIGISPENR